MAKLLRCDGSSEDVQPAHGTHFSLEEMQTLVGGYIEIVETRDGLLMIIDEEGKLKGKQFNPLATDQYIYGEHDPIVGEALKCTRIEAGESDDDDDATEDHTAATMPQEG